MSTKARSGLMLSMTPFIAATKWSRSPKSVVSVIHRVGFPMFYPCVRQFSCYYTSEFRVCRHESCRYCGMQGTHRKPDPLF